MTTFHQSFSRPAAAGLLAALMSLAVTLTAHAAAAPPAKRTVPAAGSTPSLADDGDGGGGSTGTTAPTYFEQGILSRSGETIQPLGPNLMGDRLNEFSGGLQFNQMDVTLPGNHALPVAVGRTLAMGTRQAALNSGLFGDWDLEIPRLHTVAFQTKPDWYGGNGYSTFNQNRCSQFAVPPPSSYNANNHQMGLSPATWWSGYQMYVPGSGDQTLLSRAGGSPTNPTQPTDGGSYPVLTKQHWQLSCLGSLERGTGEGFLARSPDGTRYQFDHMVQRSYPVLNIYGKANLPRLEIWILPTLVTDRFGNWVRYNYGGADGWRVTSITSSDGRSISFGYTGSGNRIGSVSDGTRTWNYAYDGAGALQSVTLPDGSQWRFALTDLERDPFAVEDYGCSQTAGARWDPNPHVGTITHPSGAVGSFELRMTLHGRSNVPGSEDACEGPPTSGPYRNRANLISRYFATYALTKKTLSGPGMPAISWAYAYGGGAGSFEPCNNCNGSKTVTITDPQGSVFQNTYGTKFGIDDGLLLSSTEGSSNATLRTTNYAYRASNAGPYPSVIGYNAGMSDSMGVIHTPQSQRAITQQGVTFTQTATGFDEYARVTALTRASGLNYSRNETTTYSDQKSLWVLGQVGIQTIAGQEASRTIFDLNTALPMSSRRFGKLQASYGFNADGTLASITDGLNHATTFSNYKRGLPQNIGYADGKSISAAINNIGTIASVTNEANTTWTYGYDAMGRLASKTPPGGDAVAYNPTVLAFEQVASPEYGLEAGHWRQTVATGSAVTVNYFDARWRKRLTLTYDANNPGATQRMQRFDYDAYNRTTFAAYPARSIGSIGTATPGTSTSYDALGRPLQTSADSELGTLTTNIQYLNGFQKQVTNPRGYATTTGYQVFDQPSETALAWASGPEGFSLAINRDIFGKPLSVTRSGPAVPSGPSSVTRSYVYDGNHLLCKTIEPEIGATVQSLDAANNVEWRATGLNLGGGNCDTASVPAAAKGAFTYDARNRLTGTGYGDGSPSIGRAYTADGLPLTVVSDGSTWTYGYNNRRLLTSEVLEFPGGGGWRVSRSYDANANASAMTYPDATSVDFNPNALGEATRVGGYATNVSYHPNGAVAGYTLGNGIVHSLTQNMRGLPLVNRDAGVLQDQYGFDANGNVSGITDQQEGISSRSMGYDGLDRLTAANAPNVWGNASYGYDGLDNLRASTVGGRGIVHGYDATNRLASLTINGAVIGYAYDSQGNITGKGGQGYYFDQGNRMQLANGVASYAYDGLGRRVLAYGANGTNTYQLYSQDGQLLIRQPVGGGVNNSYTLHIYLGGKTIAEHNSSSGVTYSHTDALGSPVAKTNAAGALISRTRYEAYGNTAAGTNPNGPGFTGHVNDPDTGLVYMQQRYYDPIAGRFLSVDPVTTDAATGSLFNRYNYAYNNPYRFTDPDGRFGIAGALVGAGIEALAQWSVTGSVSDLKAVAVAAAVGAVTGGVGGYAAKAALTGATTAGKAITATAAVGGAAAAAGKHAEGALKGETVSAKDAGIAAAGGALGAGAGAKLANGAAGTLEKMAASKDGVVAGMASATRGAIAGGGPAQVTSTVGSEAAQKSIDAGVAVGQKVVEEKTK